MPEPRGLSLVSERVESFFVMPRPSASGRFVISGYPYDAFTKIKEYSSIYNTEEFAH